MHPAVRYFLLSKLIVLIAVASAFGGDLSREFDLRSSGTVEINNPHGRVSVKMVSDNEGRGTVSATSAGAVDPSELGLKTSGEKVSVDVVTRNAGKRIDLVLNVPARARIKVTTQAGAIDIGGNFAAVEARSDTGTISVDVPTDDLRYQLRWTESRPRYLADIELADVKERSGGKFEIKGTAGEKDRKKKKNGSDEGDTEIPASGEAKELPKSISLDLTTARGIILVNVPASEVMADLRQRPLTEAAKAIIRSAIMAPAIRVRATMDRAITAVTAVATARPA